MKTLLNFLATTLMVVSLNCDYSTSPDVNSPSQNQNVPEGAYFANRFVERPAPPDSFTTANLWFVATTLSPNQTSDVALIVIDYMKWYEKDLTTGTETLIGVVNYDDPVPRPLTRNEGGLYDRFPVWFYTDNHDVINSSSIVNGYLNLDVLVHPERIYHWWCPRMYVSHNKSYSCELRIKITGKTSIQFGMDWWRSMNSESAGLNVNNRLAFCSDWHGQTNDSFVIIKESL